MEAGRPEVKKIIEPTWLQKVLSKIIDATKFILDLVDDLIVALKDSLPVAEKMLNGIMGSTFGVLCFYLSYEAARDLLADYRNTIDHSEQRRRRMIRNGWSLFLSLLGSSLSLALIIAAWSSLTVLGAAFFPFIITSTLLIASMLKSVELYFDFKEATNKEKAKKHFIYQLIDAASFLIIVLGLGLGTFTSLSAILLFPHFSLPLLFIALGASTGVMSKFCEHYGFEKVTKYLLNMVKNVAVAIKDTFLSLGNAILGSIFGVLCFYLAYEAYRDWQHIRNSADYNSENPSDRCIRNARRHSLNLKLSLIASGLALALIIGTWTSLPVAGVAFFPFAIMLTLLISSAVKCLTLHYDFKDAITEKGKAALEKQRNYQLTDTASFSLIVIGVALGTFASLTMVSLAFILIGAFASVVGKYWFRGDDKHADHEAPKAVAADHGPRKRNSSSDLTESPRSSFSSMGFVSKTESDTSGNIGPEGDNPTSSDFKNSRPQNIVIPSITHDPGFLGEQQRIKDAKETPIPKLTPGGVGMDFPVPAAPTK